MLRGQYRGMIDAFFLDVVVQMQDRPHMSSVEGISRSTAAVLVVGDEFMTGEVRHSFQIFPPVSPPSGIVSEIGRCGSGTRT